SRLCGGHMRRLGFLFALFVSLSAPLVAQVPTGTIAGTVTDQVAAVLPKATITVMNKGTGGARLGESDSRRPFLVASLQAGSYDVLIEAAGFQPTVTPVEVAVGTTTTVKIMLQVSTRTEAITVTGAASLVDLESNKVQGLVQRQQIENLPLNGRSFLNL